MTPSPSVTMAPPIRYRIPTKKQALFKKVSNNQPLNEEQEQLKQKLLDNISRVAHQKKELKKKNLKMKRDKRDKARKSFLRLSMLARLSNMLEDGIEEGEIRE